MAKRRKHTRTKRGSADLAPSGAEIAKRILILRGQRVLLDADLAELYGVTTGRLNQQVSRNPDRFPEDFCFQLTSDEWANLKSQNVISSQSGHGGRRTPPRAFSEQGVAMLSGVLTSPTAVRVNVEIMRAFVRLRQLLAEPGELARRLNELLGRVDRHDRDLQVILQILDQLVSKPDPPRRKIEF